MGILSYLFYCIWILFPLGVVMRIGIFPQAFVYPVDIAVIIFVLYGVYLGLSTQKIRYPKSLLIFGIAALLSLVVNSRWLEPTQLVAASLYLVRFVLFSLLIPVVALFPKKDMQRNLTVIAVSLCATVVLGLAQYFLYPDLRNLMYLGWDEHLYRIFSVFLDPNFASAVFVVLFWILIYLARTVHQKWHRNLLLIAIVLTASALLLTYSRTGFLMFFTSMIVYIILERKWWMLGVFLVIFTGGIVLLPKNLQSEGVNIFRTASILSRIEAFETSIQLFQKSPIFGIGFNTYRYAQEQYLGTDVKDASHAGSGVANIYLFVLATTGMVGFAAFLIFIADLFKKVFHLRGTHRKFAHSFFALIVSILVGSLTENIFFYSFIMIIFFSVVGVIYRSMDGMQP